MKKTNSNTKFIFLLPIFLMIISSCGGVKLYVTPLGSFNSVSTRNIDGSIKYEALKTYAGVSSTEIDDVIAKTKTGIIKRRNRIFKEIIKFRGKTLNEGVDNVVKNQVGGEYLMNVRFYQVREVDPKKPTQNQITFISSGDIWGQRKGNQNIKGFSINDEVVFVYKRELKKALGDNNLLVLLGIRTKLFPKGEINKQYKGVITDLMGAEATIQIKDGPMLDIPYNILKKSTK
jgi:hypothetical protein